MSHRFGGSTYEQVNNPGPAGRELINRAAGLGGSLHTTYDGQPAIAKDGSLYVKTGEISGYGQPDWSNVPKPQVIKVSR